MEFESEDAAKIFYDEYARRLGFVMRVMSCRRSERDDEKRWVPRDGNSKTPSGFREEKSPSHWQRPVERSGYAAVSENKFEERKKIQPSTAIPAARINVPAPPRASEQVISFPPFVLLLFCEHFFCLTSFVALHVLLYLCLFFCN